MSAVIIIFYFDKRKNDCIFGVYMAKAVIFHKNKWKTRKNGDCIDFCVFFGIIDICLCFGVTEAEFL